MRSRPPISFWKSFSCAASGLTAAARGQRNLQVHLVLAAVVITVALLLEVSLEKWLWLTLCIGNVLVVELLNTAIETVVDLASPEDHELARRAKDISAGAVLVAALTSAIIGGWILFPAACEKLFPQL